MNRTKKFREGGNGSRSARFHKKNSRFGQVFSPEKITGVVAGSGKGFAFLVPSDGSGDLFIAARNLNGARHGDEVEAVKTSERRGNGECEVVRVIRRGFDEIVGLFDGKCVVSRERGFGEVKVDVRRGVGARAGDEVVARLEQGSMLRCVITEVLGREGDLETDIKSIIRAHKLPETFPKKVIVESAALPSAVTADKAASKGRRDFRGDDTVTVDGASSKDFDDAICVTREAGGYRLGVHIADVAEYVTDGSALDEEAKKRGTSVYFANRVIPMLPEKLSNGICSLNEGEDRLTLSCVIDYDSEGNRLGYFITEGVIRSKARMTYDSVEKILFGDAAEREKYSRLTPMLDAAKELAMLLTEKRKARGAVDLDSDECDIEIGADGRVTSVCRRPRLFSHRLIEEFMLAANEAVAEHFAAAKVPFVYRVHEAPPAEKVAALNDFIGFLGLSVPDRPAPSDYAALSENLDEKVRPTIQRVILRSMSKADYRPECLGHFGLALQKYCHFTSPIRRYPDLAIHRIIKYVLRRGADPTRKFADFAAEAARLSSEREKVADETERAVDDLLKASFMKDKIGEEYDAVISGVTEWGIFAEIPCGVEGLIRTETLRGSGYKFDEKRMTLSNGIFTFSLGMQIKIRVEAVNFDKVAFSVIK